MKHIDEITDELGKGIDEKIKPLVDVLLSAGYETAQSCEGHHGTTRKRVYPWVDLLSGRETLERCIKEYNKDHQPWVVDSNYSDGIKYTLRAETPEVRTAIEGLSTLEWCGKIIPYLFYKYFTNVPVTEPKGLDAEQLQKAQEQIPILAEFIRKYHGE